MNRHVTNASILLVGAVLGLLVSGCASTRIKQVSGTEFLIRAKEIEALNSFNWTTYIGISQHRAYLESGHMAFVGKGAQTTVLWTPLSELPDDVVEQLKAGNPPWKPWYPQQKSETNPRSPLLDSDNNINF